MFFNLFLNAISSVPGWGGLVGFPPFVMASPLDGAHEGIQYISPRDAYYTALFLCRHIKFCWQWCKRFKSRCKNANLVWPDTDPIKTQCPKLSSLVPLSSSLQPSTNLISPRVCLVDKAAIQLSYSSGWPQKDKILICHTDHAQINSRRPLPTFQFVTKTGWQDDC